MSRLLLAFLAALFFSACGPKRVSIVDVAAEANAPLTVEQGSVVVEVIHVMGPGGRQLDRWNRALVTSLVANGEPEVYTLERIARLGEDSAVFAGVLPSGLYRLAAFEGEVDALRRTVPYTVSVPEKAGEFFVAGGKLNSLGVMLQVSAGSWSWIYRREPTFDLPALVRSLRPDLKALEAPPVVPESLMNKNAEPHSRIKRVHPVTPLVSVGTDVFVGAQFGHVYHRAADGERAEWRLLSVKSQQTVVDVVPAQTGVLALLANGELALLDPATEKHVRWFPDVSGRATGLGHAGGRLYLVTEQPRPENAANTQAVVMRLYEMSGGVARPENRRDEWRQIGTEFALVNAPDSTVVLDDAVLFTTVPTTSSAPRHGLTRISLTDGAVERGGSARRLLRHLGGEVFAGGDPPGRWPQNFGISRDGGRTWQLIEDVAGWPVRDAEGSVIVPVATAGHASARIMRGTVDQYGRYRWEEIARFPVRCGRFMEAGFTDGKYTVFCGERVFVFESREFGWRKEALHELQSTLP